MLRPFLTTSIVVALGLLASGCAPSASSSEVSPSTTTTPAVTVPPTELLPPTGGPSRAPAPNDIGGLSRLARADASGFAMFTAGGEVDFLTGINVGSAIPGRLPAELEVDAETWRRWLPMIAGTGVHALRIYTVQPPHFYSELRDYNLAHPDHPLYLVHGVWVPEELLAETHDLFDPGVLDRIHIDIDDAVAALHGDAVLPERRGYATGTYTADVSPWIASWAFGIEMDPRVVRDSDATNQGRTYAGTYVSATNEASSTEVWLAEMLDRIAGIEAGYGRTMPLTFSNWPTTDPLVHPTEPLETEDMAGVDANHLIASEAWPGGLYASYHAYPYYPDFQRYEPGIADFDYGGQVDAYAGYLTKLRDHHAEAGLPMMVLEFGVPSSLGSAHHGSLGRDQGGHDEADAMAIDAEMLRTQHDLGLSGGFVFAWQDEWFKRTWNTMDTETPSRSPAALAEPAHQRGQLRSAGDGSRRRRPAGRGRRRRRGLGGGQLPGDPRVAWRGARGAGHPRRVLPLSPTGPGRGTGVGGHSRGRRFRRGARRQRRSPRRPRGRSRVGHLDRRRTRRPGQRVRPGVERLQRPGVRTPARSSTRSPMPTWSTAAACGTLSG